MQIVIDISEEMYKWVYDANKLYNDYGTSDFVELIKKGTPLPKVHGDLIDRSDLYNQTANWESQALEQVDKYDPMYTRDDWRWWTAVLKERTAFKHDVEDAPTIISADKDGD